MEIYHNPRCRKSRETLALIEEAGIQPEVIEYLNTPPSADELRSLLKKLNLSAEDLVRTGEEEYKTLFKGKHLSEDEWLAAMVAHPKLIERPIVVSGNKAVIGRPPERVKDLL